MSHLSATYPQLMPQIVRRDFQLNLETNFNHKNNEDNYNNNKHERKQTTVISFNRLDDFRFQPQPKYKKMNKILNKHFHSPS